MADSPIGNNDLIQRVNTRLVLQAVRRLQPTYRAEVARETRLKPATVTGIVNDLLEKRLVSELPSEPPEGARAGGRPPTLIELDRDARYILAVDLEPDRVRAARTNLMAEVVEYREQVIDRFDDPRPVMETICRFTRELLGGTDRDRVLGLGVSLPGLIDRERGVLLSSTNMPRWHDVNIAEPIQAATRIRPQIEKSAHLAAVHEDWCAPGDPDSTRLVIFLRTGIGMSLIRHGEVYTGTHGFDGEIGHTVVDLDGERCECGNRGCLETFVSAAAVCRRAESMLRQGRCPLLGEATREGQTLRPELVYRLARAGDPDCTEIAREVGRYIGIAAANLINLLGPDQIVLAGTIDTADELILEAVRKQIHSSALPKMREHLKIGLARGREKAALLGAAAMVAQGLFALPSLHGPHGRRQEARG